MTLGKSILWAVNKGSSILNDRQLAYTDNDPYDNKNHVFKDSFENIHFIINLSSSNHVENVEQYKHIENDCEMSRWTILINILTIYWIFSSIKSSIYDGSVITNQRIIWIFHNPVMSGESNDKDNDALIKGHTKDMFGHLLRNDMFSSFVWWSV